MQPDPDRILVVDDDPNVAEVLTRYLQLAGYRVEAVGDGAVALDRAIADPPMLVILDLMLPGMDGLEVCRRLRAAAPTPVIMLTAKGGESDRVIGLELGADDYVAKPFSAKELTARVKAVLRRAAGPLAGAVPGTPVELSDGDLVVDVPGRQVSRDGASIALTARAAVDTHPASVTSRAGCDNSVLTSMRGSPATITLCTPDWPSGGYSQSGAAAGVSRVVCSTVITGVPPRTPSTANRTPASRPGCQ